MKTMLNSRRQIVAVLVGTLMTTGVVFAGIKGSQHDLGSGGAAQQTTTNTSEVCVFCHTPHGANTNAGAPLWNKTLPDSGSYTRYSSLNTATLDGTEAPVGSVSLACLSCHDGSQAMDVVINAPGSGGYDDTGAGQVDNTFIGAMTGTPIPNLGTDLQNDHPISIQYAGGACNGATADCDPANSPPQPGDPDFVTVQYAQINNVDQYWVDTSTVSITGTSNVREKTDMILYTRDFGGTTGPSVECASCHDPHEEAAVGSVNNVNFMRISNDNSDVCLACHIK